jgi:HK97 family phage prohead protease
MKTEKRYISLSRAGIQLRAKGDEENKNLEGYASVFYDGTPETEYQLWDGAVERIDKAAFDNAIKNDDIRALMNHDPNLILGRNKAGTLTLEVDSVGLKYLIDVPDTQAGNDTRTSIERGDVSGSSFSFMPTVVEWSDDGDKEIRLIKEVQLFDVGPVTFPAYTAASAYARDSEPAKEEHDNIKSEREAEKEKQDAEEAAKAKADLDLADAKIKTLGL